MGFPDRIERTLEVAHPPRAVWAALTTAEGLAAWFGHEATIDLRPGGSLRMSWDDGPTAHMRVERVEEPTVFGFTWPIQGLPDDDPRRTYVEFTLEPVGAGTRLAWSRRGSPSSPTTTTAASSTPTPRAGPPSWASWSPTSMPPESEPALESVAEQVFIALADPTRRSNPGRARRGGPATATDLADRLPITRQAIAKHLELLADVGLVTAEPGSGAECATGALRADAGGTAVPRCARPRLGRPPPRAHRLPRPSRRLRRRRLSRAAELQPQPSAVDVHRDPIEPVDRQRGRGELLGRRRARHREHLAARCTGGRDACGGVLHREAPVRRHPQSSRGQEVGLRVGLAAGHVVGGDERAGERESRRAQACRGDRRGAGASRRPAGARAGSRRAHGRRAPPRRWPRRRPRWPRSARGPPRPGPVRAAAPRAFAPGWPWFSCSARADTPNSTANRSQERVTEAVESTSTPSRSNSTASNGCPKSGLAGSTVIRWPRARSARASSCRG